MFPDGNLILASIDFSAPSRLALQAAAGLARRLGAKLLLVHALDLPHDSTLLGRTLMKLVDLAAEKKKGEEALRAEAKTAQVEDVLQGVEIVAEEPGRTIPRLARERSCSLIVIGTSGREGLKHLFLGSVAEKILRQSTVPVLVIPTARKE